MPTSAYGLLILGLFGIVWLVIAWRSHLPLQDHPVVAPTVPRLLKPRTPLDCPACCPSAPYPPLLLPVPPSVPGERSKAVAARPNGSPRRALLVPRLPVLIIRSPTHTYMPWSGTARTANANAFRPFAVRMLLVRRIACYLPPVGGRGRSPRAWREGRPW
jgi:hypothetical protein